MPFAPDELLNRVADHSQIKTTLKLENSPGLFRWFMRNLAVAFGTMVLGYIGTLLSILPSTASPIWPPTGLALAVMLVYGKPILPGLYLGALLLNSYSFLNTYSFLDLTTLVDCFCLS